ncbi:hypothetical protein V8J88_12440 [Massilia sp. W12]|uniref:hypothetical protein n=1 Tax=Massilia sp. W12 TaxID=3126507 RepID=UPI0030CE222A
MMRIAQLSRSAMLLCLLAAGAANATNYTLWINGRTGGGAVGNYNSWNYWGPGATAAGVNKKSVNWDGYNNISSQSGKIRDALDCFCTGSNWCYIATHSAGQMMLGYTLAQYGASARYKKNATPNSAGQCGNSDGGTQTGWNIKWVRAAGSAAGGSELADYGSWALSEPLVKDLKTTTARAMYDHNNTQNVWFYMYAGAKGTLYSGLLPGQDDEAVSYHSSGGIAGSSGRSLGNPSDWFSNDLTLGTASNEGGSTKWNRHSVSFRDDGENHNHYASGNWGGIISVMRNDVANLAK